MAARVVAGTCLILVGLCTLGFAYYLVFQAPHHDCEAFIDCTNWRPTGWWLGSFSLVMIVGGGVLLARSRR